MKTAIAYYSEHHGNTKKLLDAICAVDKEVTLINVTEKREVNLPSEKPVFFIATCGNPIKSYFKSIRKVANDKRCNVLGEYLCLGFDTFGPFKLVGGIQKGHPTEKEIQDAVEFYQGLKE
ncbi:MAG: flavodoxin [Lachnospiraceae bacterium]|nr:flavodoxin [Lachnospiraceae bacterium]